MTQLRDLSSLESGVVVCSAIITVVVLLSIANIHILEIIQEAIWTVFIFKFFLGLFAIWILNFKPERYSSTELYHNS